MQKVKRVKPLQYIRKLRGGSQPILVRADDGLVYVVKFSNNLQGPNLPFNEALGTELFRVAGFNVPKWRLVEVSDDFIDRNPSCWMETECGKLRLIFYSLGMPSARKLLISLRAVVEYFKM